MHVHGVRMSLLSRDSIPPATHEQGLRDTFVVGAMQTIGVAVPTPTVSGVIALVAVLVLGSAVGLF